MKLLVKSNSYDFLYLLHLWLKFYYIYGWFLLHLRWVFSFMVDFYYIYGWCYFSWLIITFMDDTASQLGAGDLIGSQYTYIYIYIYIYNEYLAIIDEKNSTDWGGSYRPRWITSSKIF